MESDLIVVRGARQHNLKNITVEIPKKKLVVFSGVSGSGKSSLAFDTLNAEGQRRYVESLSNYARQFLGQMDKPVYDTIQGLSPTIAVDQKSSSHNPRSTVGTITEIYDYFRVLFARIGKLSCYRCSRPVAKQTPQQIVQEIGRLSTGTRFQVLSPLVEGRKGQHRSVFENARKAGFSRVRVDGENRSLQESIELDKNKKHSIEIVIDRLIARPELLEKSSRLTDSVETALESGKGVLVVHRDGQEDLLFSEHHSCHHCGLSFPELTPQLFSFNSPQGMCTACNGLGTKAEMDEELMVPDNSLSINQGAIKPWGTIADKGGWRAAVIRSLSRHYGFDLDVSWRNLSTDKRQLILYGGDKEKITVRKGRRTFKTRFEGLVPILMRRMKATRSESVRKYYSQFMSNKLCSSCNGARLRPEALSVSVAGKSLAELVASSVGEAFLFTSRVELKGTEALIGSELLKQITSLLRFLCDVGLDYLTLDRLAPTLSGGESQRIRLASQIGSELTGVIYILDEPSIGLHSRDNARLLKALGHLRDMGNTVVVVEHDRETIEAADHVIDFGPGAGAYGGKVIATGRSHELCASGESITGKYISGQLSITVPSTRRTCGKKRLEIEGASENNLNNLHVEIPLGVFLGVTGVSGAGKSTLVNEILYPVLAKTLNRAEVQPGGHQAIRGIEFLDKVINIDQSPIGRTPRSNPGTYTKVFDEIRKFFTELSESKVRGYKAGRFSFNVKGGRCEHCTGDGVIQVEMHFLADVYVPCEECRGRRFNDATLEVKYRGLSIADVLDRTVDEARDLFENHPRIRKILDTLIDVGLGYIRLGQSSPTLSGGEAQRVKLSRELAKRSTGRTFYMLDEPTTGLHFHDIAKLLNVLQRLVDGGNSVLVIEHNLDVLKTTDYLIDLGPEGGDQGGYIVAVGTPEEVALESASHTGKALRSVLGQPELDTVTKRAH